MTTEREKVVRAIKICMDADGKGDCAACPYFNDPEDLRMEWCKRLELGRDMLKLLEPKKPKIGWFAEGRGLFECADCGGWVGSIRVDEKEIIHFDDFCHKCGMEVDWSDYQ